MSHRHIAYKQTLKNTSSRWKRAHKIDVSAVYMCNRDTEGHSKQKWAAELQGLLKRGALPMKEEVQLLNFKEIKTE